MSVRKVLRRVSLLTACLLALSQVSSQGSATELRQEIARNQQHAKSSTTLSASELETIDAIYAEAAQLANQIDAERERIAQYRDALDQFTERRALALAKLEKARVAAAKITDAGSPKFKSREELKVAISRAQAELASAESQVAALRSQIDELSRRQSNLPELVQQAKQAAAQIQSDQTVAETDGKLSELEQARAVLARAKAQAAKISAEAMSLEQASHDARKSLLEIALQETTTTLKGHRERLTAIEKVEAEMADRGVRAAESLLEKAKEASGDDQPTLSGKARELANMTNLYRELTIQNAQASELLSKVNNQRDYVEAALREVRELADIAGITGGFAEVIFSHLQQVGASELQSSEQGTILADLSKARAQLFDVRQKLRRFESDSDAMGKALSTSDPIPALDIELTEQTESLLRDIESSALRLVQTLANAEVVGRQVRLLSEEYREVATQQLFWVKSAPPVDASFFLRIPAMIKLALTSLASQHSLTSGNQWALVAAIALLAFRLLSRQKLLEFVARSNQTIRKASRDSYMLTLLALGATLLASLPVPLALLILGSGFPEYEAENPALMPILLPVAALLVFHLAFLANLVRRNGVAEGHFGWKPTVLAALRTAVLFLAIILLPAKFLLTFALSQFSGEMLAEIARLGLILTVVGTGSLFAFLLRQRRSLEAVESTSTAQATYSPSNSLWSGLVIALALILLLLLLSGFVMTVWLLVSRIEASLLAVFWASIAYGLAIRLFAIRERKLKIEDALAARKARREALAATDKKHADDQPSSSPQDEIIEAAETESTLDINEVCRQTRSLIGFLISTALLATLWFLWTQFAPVVKALDERTLVFGLSIADLGLIVLVIVVVVAVVRNLPALLEALIFHRLKLDAGSRNAIVTLTAYAVFGIAALFLFGQIGVDWTQFAWLAAALSVGIGFGLQEVVANFISGIILLFERPIRVGDVVTVDQIDGVVSRIQIRATTITGWDRKEYVVPNKNFITGTVLNWTLSNPVNRIIVVVGVAYGTDTERARQILIDIAQAHPNVLKDPAPMASFEEFGDSALKLILRAYLPNMDNRIATLTDINTEIARRFAEEGIEIAFPQLDVHLKQA